mmetsp:Transcript_17370/g.39694  ORF Transcript_17370/g.39694 Transcript_17370/m.39694 type:complete len:211 (+) Transcript_17370:233-865(+)
MAPPMELARTAPTPRQRRSPQASVSAEARRTQAARKRCGSERRRATRRRRGRRDARAAAAPPARTRRRAPRRARAYRRAPCRAETAAACARPAPRRPGSAASLRETSSATQRSSARWRGAGGPACSARPLARSSRVAPAAHQVLPLRAPARTAARLRPRSRAPHDCRPQRPTGTRRCTRAPHRRSSARSPACSACQTHCPRGAGRAHAPA